MLLICSRKRQKKLENLWWFRVRGINIHIINIYTTSNLQKNQVKHIEHKIWKKEKFGKVQWKNNKKKSKFWIHTKNGISFFFFKEKHWRFGTSTNHDYTL